MTSASKTDGTARESTIDVTSTGGTPNVANGIACRKGIILLDHIVREPRDPSLPADCRNHGGIRSDAGLGNQTPGKCGAQNSFVNKVLEQGQLSLRVQCGHLRARACPARRAIQR